KTGAASPASPARASSWLAAGTGGSLPSTGSNTSTLQEGEAAAASAGSSATIHENACSTRRARAPASPSPRNAQDSSRSLDHASSAAPYRHSNSAYSETPAKVSHAPARTARIARRIGITSSVSPRPPRRTQSARASGATGALTGIDDGMPPRLADARRASQASRRRSRASDVRVPPPLRAAIASQDASRRARARGPTARVPHRAVRGRRERPHRVRPAQRREFRPHRPPRSGAVRGGRCGLGIGTAEDAADSLPVFDEPSEGTLPGPFAWPAGSAAMARYGGGPAPPPARRLRTQTRLRPDAGAERRRAPRTAQRTRVRRPPPRR